MHKLLVDGGVIRCTPGPGWSWSGWDGTLSIDAPARELRTEGKGVALAADIARLGLKLQGKIYTATGYADVPGTVLAAQVTCTEGTLSPVVTFAGDKAVTTGTRGESFLLGLVPSLKAGAPPVPDPTPVKRGTWTVDQPGQTVTGSS